MNVDIISAGNRVGVYAPYLIYSYFRCLGRYDQNIRWRMQVCCLGHFLGGRSFVRGGQPRLRQLTAALA